MSVIAGALIGAGASFLGGLLNRQTSIDSAEKQYDLGMAQLQYQKELQKQIFEREDTTYARTVKDMRNAGLSPLTMSGTDGAGTPIPVDGAYTNMANAQATKDTGSQLAIDSAINGVADFMRFGSEQRSLESQIKQSEAETALKWAELADKEQDTSLKKAMKKIAIEQANATLWNTRASTRKIDAEANLKDRQLYMAKVLGVGEVVPEDILRKVIQLNIATSGDFRLVPSKMTQTYGNGGTEMEKDIYMNHGGVLADSNSVPLTEEPSDSFARPDFNSSDGRQIYYLSSGSGQYKGKVMLSDEQYKKLQEYLMATKALDVVTGAIGAK